jgi:DNA repair protein RecO (recombination protein O)
VQPGNLVAASWRGRLEEHLGTFDIELLRAHAAGMLDDPDRLAALAAAAALVAVTVPEREPHGDVYQGLAALILALDSRDWPARYIEWECALLAALGYGLDLSACAATGINDDLVYVSPRTGRAVSRSAGLPYHDKLLPLPAFLWSDRPAESADIAAGLMLAGHFLFHHLLAPHGRTLPEARTRLAERLRRLV